jgi:hypothetical protein
MKTFKQFKEEVEEITGIDVYSFTDDPNSLQNLIFFMQEEILALHARIKALETKQ